MPDIPRLTPPNRPLGDGVVIVRPVDERDRAALMEASRQADIVDAFGPPPAPGQEIEFFLWRWEEGTSGGFAICDPDGETVGMVMIETRPQGHADLGYWMLAKARGKGYAARATRLVAMWALKDQRLPRVQLWAAAENTASQRVAEASGFHYEGRLRNHGRLPGGQRVDALYYSLIPDDLT